MSVMTLDETTIKKLRACGTDVELRDSHGNVIGIFQPAKIRVYERGEVPELPVEELHRRLASHERLSTDEVKRRLMESSREP